MVRRSGAGSVLLAVVAACLVAALHADTENPSVALSRSAVPRREWRGVAQVPVRLLCCAVNASVVASSASSAFSELTEWLARKGADLKACLLPPGKLPAFTHWVNSRRTMHPEIDMKAFRNTPKGVDAVNEEMVAALLGLDRAGGWRRVREDKDCGIAVFRARPAALAWSHGAGPADPASRFDAIKGTGEIEAAPHELLDIFMDNARLPEFNQYCSEIEDLGELRSSVGRSKISWSATPRIGPLRPRDFVTRVHCRCLKDGTCVVVNVGEQLVCGEQRTRGKAGAGGYVRMEILIGGQIMRPVKGQRTRTAYTTIIHSNPGGAMDSGVGAWVVNRIAVQGPVELMHSLRACAAKIHRGSAPG